MKVAIIHDWFVVVGGAEKVLEQLISIYPNADVFFVCADFKLIKSLNYFNDLKVVTSFIQKFPFVKSSYRNYLPLMPLAVEQFDLSDYDLIVSSSHAVAKGVLTGPDQLHISYLHSPIRYAWDLQHQYLRESNLNLGIKAFLVKWMLHKIRIWDYRTAAGVDYFVANSKFISRRIHKVYGCNSEVIYPPVDVTSFHMCEQKENFYFTASRIVPYKKMDLIVRAFSQMPGKKLVVIGDGPDMPKLRALATPNITLLGYQPFADLKRHMQQAKAFVFAAEEDFGITPVEAQACGTPVIAYGKGGSLETVVDSSDQTKATGIWFREQTAESLIAAIHRFESLPSPISPHVCRAHAERFSNERFRKEFGQYVNSRWCEFKSSLLHT